MKKMLMKFALVPLFGIFLLLGIVSCARPAITWDDIDKFSDSKELQASCAIEENKLIITINNEDAYLKGVSKNNIIFRDSVADVDSKKKELSGSDLVNSGINEYELEILDKYIRVTLDDYKESLYYVIFNKETTRDRKYAYAAANLIENPVLTHKYTYVFEEDEYINGQKDPSFTIGFNDLFVKDTSKIEFSSAFEGLTYKKSTIEENKVVLFTTGEISLEKIGIITLKEGFFEDAEFTSTLYFDVSPLGYIIDNRSFVKNDNEVSFDVLLTNSVFNSDLTKDDITIPGYTVSSISLNQDKDTLNICFDSDKDLDETLDSLKGKFLSMSRTSIAHPLDEDIKIEFDINTPTTSIEATLEGKELKLEVRYFDIIESDVNLEHLEITSSELIFDGAEANASITSVEDHPNGFDIYITTNEILTNIDGTLNVDNSAEFKTLWGTPYLFDSLEFLATQNNTEVLSFPAKNNEEEFEQKAIDSTPPIEAASDILLFTAYAAKLGASIYTGNVASGIDSVLGILGLFGINGDSGQPSMQDVMNKLNDISKQLNKIDVKLDSLKQQMSDAQASIQLGIDKVLFNQYRANWDGFKENYVQKMEDYLRNFQADLHSYYIEFVRNSEDVTLTLSYVEENNKLLLCIENPKDPGYSLEGVKIKSTKDIKITKSFYEEAIESIRKTQGYNSNFDLIFKNCISNNLKNDNPSMTDDELKLLANDVYAHITGQALIKASKEDLAKNVTNLFIDFCHQLTGKGLVASRISDYFKMMECYYNFESDARRDFLAFRSNTKVTLDKFAGFATMISVFCPGIERKEITKAYNETAEYIKKNTNIRVTDHIVPEISNSQWKVDYSYVTNSKIAAYIIAAKFNIYYDDANSNKCSLKYSINLSNYINSAISSDASSYINNSRLINSTDLETMLKREIYRRKTEGQSTNGLNLYNYLESKGFIDGQYNSIWSYYLGQGHGQALPEKVKVITSYDGLAYLSKTDFTTYCVAKGNGNYFSTGSNYAYGSNYTLWDGREIKGTVYDMEKSEAYDSGINRVCWYSESHWYWSTDEYWAFEEYYDAFYGLVFLRVN